MQFSAIALLASAAVASAHYGGNVTYTTVVVPEYSIVCPEATTLTHGDKTYTVTEPTTLTIDCPCTVTKPVITSSIVECHDCPKPTAPAVPTYEAPKPHPPPAHNTTIVPVPTTTPEVPSEVPTAGAAKAVALSGAGLAGVLGFAALLL